MKAPRALSTAMRAELLPLLQSLGWTFTSDHPFLAEPEQIVRLFDGRKQTIWFDYVSESKISITVSLWDTDTRTPGARHTVRACVRDPVVRQSLWKRLSRLGKSSPPLPADPIEAAVDKAKDDILVADSFLKTGEASDRIHVR